MGIVRLNQTDRRIIIKVLRQAQDDLGPPDNEWKRRVADDLKRIETNLSRGLKPATVTGGQWKEDVPMTFFGQDSKEKVFWWLAVAIVMGAFTGGLAAYLIFDAVH